MTQTLCLHTIVPRVYLLIEDKSGTTKLYASTTRLPSAHFGRTKLICQLVALLLLFGVKIKGYTCLLDTSHIDICALNELNAEISAVVFLPLAS